MTEIIFGDRVGKEGSIRIGCAALLFDEARAQVLLTRRADTGQWCLPSGGLEPGESTSEACERETLEETGLHVSVRRLISIFSSPDRLAIYADGARFQFVVFAFEVELLEGIPGLSDETTAVGYFPLAALENLDIFPHHRQFILDALSCQHAVFIR